MNFLEKVIVNPSISLKKGQVYPFVEMANVGLYSRDPQLVDSKAFSSGSKFADGDTVVARITPCLQNGKAFYCHNIGEGFGSTEFIVFRPKDETLDHRYLYYLMQTSFIREKMIKSMVGATGRQRVNNDVFKSIDIRLPNLQIQKKLADTLNSYDDLIENNRKQIKLLEEAAQRLYKEWFVDLRFPGHEHTKIVDGVPEGWEKSTVLNVSSVLRRGISPKYNARANFTVINQKCIRQTVVTFDEARKQEKFYPEEMSLQDSDTVICSTGAGTLGRVGQIFGNYPQTTFDSHVTLVRAKSCFGKQRLFQCLKYCQSYFMGRGKGSTNQLELSRETIQNLVVLIPPEEIVRTFESLAQSMHDKISAVNAEIDRLQSARDRLLPQLMSGNMEE